MNTDSSYMAVKDIEERGAAINLVVQIRKALSKGLTGELTFKTGAPQFNPEAEALVKRDFSKGLSFSFSFDKINREITVTMAPKKVRVLFLEDTTAEEEAIEKDKCDFAVVQRSPEIFVSTREKTSVLRNLGWKTLLGEINGGIKRFRASAVSREKFLKQLEGLYPGAEIIVDG